VLKVALTGGIATGKSHVLQELRRRGVPCLDADELAHEVTLAGTAATRDIARRFGSGVLDSTGAVDRKKLAALVFEDASARRDLEAIVHPAVYHAIAAGLGAIESGDGPPLAVVDVPLLYETGRAADFDKVIATTCRADVQRARLIARGLTPEEARQRLAAQLSSEEKASRSDYVIRTDGTFDDTAAQVEHVLAELAALQ
jgi:dephospho-CoA kinase